MDRPQHTFYNKIRVHAYLRRPNSEGYYQVRIVAYFHNTSFSVAPGLLVLPERKVGRKMEQLWEPKTGRVLSGHPDATDINNKLQDSETKIVAAFRALAGPTGDQQVTREMLDLFLFPRPANQTAPQQLSMSQQYELWAAENASIYSKHHIKQFEYIQRQLQQWRPGLKAVDLNEKLVRDWQKHLLGLGKADGTIANHFKFFRLMATQIGLNPKAPWLKYQEVNSVQLDLTREELRALITVQLEDPRLAEERDRWLLQCLTGRRDADMQLLRPEQVTTLRLEEGQEVAALRHHQSKTTAEVLLPLPPLAVRIGERWGWTIPQRLNKRRNIWIKEVAKLAGLNRLFNDAKISGGNVTDNYRPLYEIIGTHTTRHTAGSLLLEVSAGDKSLAGYLLGHSQGSSTTNIYAKDKARRVAGPMLQAWQQILGELYDQPPTWVHDEPVRIVEAKARKKRT